ncbi:ubiquinone biosynthesis protein COQ7-domain-containing protein [Bisporella sp. PMI_857]|nr:ubiquinone biosynthesis protein COQ7-domain-containing protein [Bisporella sp. PMI_857]
MSLRAAQRRSALANHPLYDFLAPGLLQFPPSKRNVRYVSTTQKAAQGSPPNAFKADHEPIPNPKSPKKPLTQAQRDFLSSALRVNQAGELAATLIYTAQMPPIINSHPHLRPLMKHMYDQEAGHFTTFNELLAKHRVRPTAMYPIWTLASTALGWGTAVMGREAAMACTEAVETEIGGHYNDQVRELLDLADKMEKDGDVMGEELQELTSIIRRIRDEELEHLDHALEHDAKEARPYELLTGVIRAGCRGAIWISERV